MSENIFAYEMDIATKKVSPISKDIIRDCDVTFSDGDLFKPIPSDVDMLQGMVII